MTKQRASSKSLIGIFAKNIRSIRQKIGISQEELADRAQLHRTYIGSIERRERNVSLENIEKLANALNVKPSTLIDDAKESSYD